MRKEKEVFKFLGHKKATLSCLPNKGNIIWIVFPGNTKPDSDNLTCTSVIRDQRCNLDLAC